MTRTWGDAQMPASSVPGGNPPMRPDQAVQTLSRAGSGPAPQQSTVFARRIIVAGPGEGMFSYFPTVGPNNLVASTGIAIAGTDPYGNNYLAGDTVYGLFSGAYFALQMFDAGLQWYIGGATQAAAYVPTVSIGQAVLVGSAFTGLMVRAGPSFALADPGIGGQFREIWLAPSGDATGVTDITNINAAFGLIGGPSANTVVHPLAGQWHISAPIQIPSNGEFRGFGEGTQINAVAGFTGAMVGLASAASVSCIIADLFLNAQSVAGVTQGVLLDNGGTGGVHDHLVDNVLVRNCSGDGFALPNGRGSLLRGCRSESVLGFGFNIGGTDNMLADCTSGTSLNHGFNITGVNNLVNGCKGYFAGNNYTNGLWTGASVHGIYCNAFFNVITGCSFQQNAVHGIYLDGTTGSAAYGCTVTGNECDSNSAAVANLGSGIFVNGINFTGRATTISGNSGQNNLGLPVGIQLYGVQIQGANPDVMLIGNTIAGSAGYFNAIAGATGYYRIDPTYGIWSAVGMSAGWAAGSPAPSAKPLIGFMAYTAGFATHAAFAGNSQIGTVPAAFIPATFQVIPGVAFPSNAPVLVSVANVTGALNVTGAPAATTGVEWNGSYPLDL
jgi:hypothetical protein